MKLTKCIIPLLSILFFIACSSDPCEDVNCVNGSCVDGTCECLGDFLGTQCDELPCVNGTSSGGSCTCEEGWTGRLCDERDVVGTWWLTKLELINCPDYNSPPLIEGVVSDEKACATATNGQQICYAWRFTLRDDGRYSRINESYVIHTDGTEENLNYRTSIGSWEFVNDRLRLNSTTSGSFTNYDIDGYTLFREIADTRGGLSCLTTFTFERE